MVLFVLLVVLLVFVVVEVSPRLLRPLFAALVASASGAAAQ